MQRSACRLPPAALLLATALFSIACDRSPSEPVARVPAIKQLALTVSSTLAVGRTVTPTVGAYGSSTTSYLSGDVFFYPADSGAKAELTSSNAAAVRVNGDGTVSAVAAGTAYVSAALGGHRDSVLVSVIPGYELTLLAATDSVTLVDVNDAGDVAGYIYTAPGQGGVLIRGGQRIDLGNCFPVAMNNAGQIACNQFSPVYTRGAHPAVYANGVITFPLPDTVTGVVTGISESGRIYGAYERSDAPNAGIFVGGPGGMDYVRPGFAEYTGSINSALHGVTISNSCMYCSGLILRPEGPGPVYLSGFGRYSWARDINDADNVIGSGEDMSIPGSRAILWRKANQWKPEVFSLRVRILSGISERDQIVGGGLDGAFVWNGGRYTFLADAVKATGWTFKTLPVISRSGVIAARGEHPSLGTGIVVIRLP